METLASVLKHLARFCLGAAFIILVSGLIDTWMTRGGDVALALLRPDILNVLVLALPFAPGVLLLMCASVAKARADAAPRPRVQASRRSRGLIVEG